MLIKEIALSGPKLIELPAFKDDRGLFVKTFQDSVFQKSGIRFELKESYFSISHKDVIRGMHFQLPPHQHSKIVFCPKGAILDVLVDLRKGSPSYGQFCTEVLSEENHRALFIPEGFAHGFKSLTDGALTYYFVSSEYHKESDTGIRWDSFGFDWDCLKPVISQRDKGFVGLDVFETPF